MYCINKMNFSENAILEDNDLYLLYPKDNLILEKNDNTLFLIILSVFYLMIWIFGTDILL